MKEIYKKKCKCCGETFVTTKGNKVYITGHQKPNNNENQNAKRKKLHELNKPLSRNYQVFDELLGKKDSVDVSFEYLSGRKVQTGWMTHMDKYNGVKERCIHDIVIKVNSDHLTLIRK